MLVRSWLMTANLAGRCEDLMADLMSYGYGLFGFTIVVVLNCIESPMIST